MSYLWLCMLFLSGCVTGPNKEPVPPTQGVLGFPLRTLITVEGRCPREKEAYQALVVRKVNGQKLRKTVTVYIDNLSLNVPVGKVVMKGYEDSELRKGVAIRWFFTGAAVPYYALWFYPTEVLEPNGIKYTPSPMPN